MKCRRAQRWLLLESSGELSFLQQRRLQRHLLSCVACRGYQQELSSIMMAARQDLPERAPSAFSLAAIKAAADAALALQQPSPSSRARPAAWRAWRPALASAAILVLCWAGWLGLRGVPAIPSLQLAWPARDTYAALELGAVAPAPPPVSEFDSLVALLMEDVVAIELISHLSNNQNGNQLDQEFLLLEGLAI